MNLARPLPLQENWGLTGVEWLALADEVCRELRLPKCP